MTQIVGGLSQDAEIPHIYDSASRRISVRIPDLLIGEIEMSPYVKAVYEDTGVTISLPMIQTPFTNTEMEKCLLE